MKKEKELQIRIFLVFEQIAAACGVKAADTHADHVTGFEGKPDILILHSKGIPRAESTLVVVELKIRNELDFSNEDHGQIFERFKRILKHYSTCYGILTNGKKIEYFEAWKDTENYWKYSSETCDSMSPLQIHKFIRYAQKGRNVPVLPESAHNALKGNDTCEIVVQQLLGKGSSCEVWSILKIIEGIEYGNVLNIARTPSGIDDLKRNARIIRLLGEEGALIEEFRNSTTYPFPSYVWEGTDSNSAYYMITYPEGRRYRPPKQRLTHLQLSDVLTLLAFLHSLGYVHRDVEARNIIIVEDRAMMIDYGCTAKCEEEVQDAGCTLCVHPEILQKRIRKVPGIKPQFYHDLWSLIAVSWRAMDHDKTILSCKSNEELLQFWERVTSEVKRILFRLFIVEYDCLFGFDLGSPHFIEKRLLVVLLAQFGEIHF